MDILPTNDREGFSPFGSLLLLLLLLLLGSAIGNGLGALVGMFMDLAPLQVMESFDQHSPLRERQFVRWMVFFNQLFTFTVPALVLGIILQKRGWPRFFQLHTAPRAGIFLAGVLFLFGLFVLSLAAYWLNQQLPLPDWAGGMEQDAARLTQGLLVMNGFGEFLLTLLTVAILPAVGEELVFRGVLQRQIQLSTGSPLLAIWLAALLFSLVHFQFAGFLPRLLLGAGLGYLFYWTNSLWVPIVAHFFNNGFQIVGQYIRRSAMSESSGMEVNWGATAVAALLVAGLSYYLYRYFKHYVKPREEPDASQP